MGCRVLELASGHATVRVFVFAVDGHAREVQAVFCSALERGAERCETRSRRVTSAVVESRVPGGTARQADEIYVKLFLYAFTRLSLCKLSFHISHGLRWYTYTFTFLLWRVPRHVPRSNALECELSVRFRLRCSRHCVKASQHETGFDAGGLKQVSAWLAGELVDVEINEEGDDVAVAMRDGVAAVPQPAREGGDAADIRLDHHRVEAFAALTSQVGEDGAPTAVFGERVEADGKGKVRRVLVDLQAGHALGVILLEMKASWHRRQSTVGMASG